MTLRLRANTVFFLLVSLVYSILFFAASGLQGPLWSDENWFWETSQQFSHRLIPTIEQLKNYNELNTPLPFIIYGALEYLFSGGVFIGRLLNLFLSLAITFLIGWPKRYNDYHSVLSAVGLFLSPYFLWLSTRYYTDVIASFFVILGVLLYVQERHVVSGLAFILAISARQYMLAFPLAIASHELLISIQKRQRPSLAFVLPCAAALSILGWFALFNGLAPPNAYVERPEPEVQRVLLAIKPSSALFFLSAVGLDYVVPEFLLLHRKLSYKHVISFRNLLIAAILLALFICFPPIVDTNGLLGKVSDILFFDWVRQPAFYLLALFACWRFSRMGLGFWLLLFNALIMLKSYPLERYALPITIVLWYLQSIHQLDDSIDNENDKKSTESTAAALLDA